MTADPRITDADVETAARAHYAEMWEREGEARWADLTDAERADELRAARAVLDALVAAGWTPRPKIHIHIDPAPPEVRIIPVPIDPRTGRPL